MNKRWLKKLCLTATTSIFIQMSVFGADASAVEKDIVLSEENSGEIVNVLTDADILDYPARKEGEVQGELLEGDEVTLLGTVQNVWGKVQFDDGQEEAIIGYVPLDSLQLEEKVVGGTGGTLHKGTGEGVFTEAIDGVTQVNEGPIDGITIATGEAISASADAKLKSMGKFRITHYCPCGICCGPYSNGITATGTTCTSNRTIAVNPTQIPYGSRVVINGQIFVAEDCGGAIRDNCIDVFVPTHAEALAAGVYYTDVYILLE